MYCSAYSSHNFVIIVFVVVVAAAAAAAAAGAAAAAAYFIYFEAILWLRGLVAGPSQRRCEFDPRAHHVGFVVDKVVLGQDFLQVLRFSCHSHSVSAPCSFRSSATDDIYSAIDIVIKKCTKLDYILFGLKNTEILRAVD
jgi:hypothetical protein